MTHAEPEIRYVTNCCKVSKREKSLNVLYYLLMDMVHVHPRLRRRRAAKF